MKLSTPREQSAVRLAYENRLYVYHVDDLELWDLRQLHNHAIFQEPSDAACDPEYAIDFKDKTTMDEPLWVGPGHLLFSAIYHIVRSLDIEINFTHDAVELTRPKQLEFDF